MSKDTTQIVLDLADHCGANIGIDDIFTSGLLGAVYVVKVKHWLLNFLCMTTQSDTTQAMLFLVVSDCNIVVTPKN